MHADKQKSGLTNVVVSNDSKREVQRLHTNQTTQCKLSESETVGEAEDNSPIAAVSPNRTGMPDQLKAGLENLSGYDLSSVRVHYNSSKPKQFGALAYTQDTDIHIGPGQQKHLPHEGWHVVQQMQGRVKPTLQTKGIKINDNKRLEQEAEEVGKCAIKLGYSYQRTSGNWPNENRTAVIQMMNDKEEDEFRKWIDELINKNSFEEDFANKIKERADFILGYRYPLKKTKREIERFIVRNQGKQKKLGIQALPSKSPTPTEVKGTEESPRGSELSTESSSPGVEIIKETPIRPNESIGSSSPAEVKATDEDTYYHITTNENLASILKHGLQPEKSGTGLDTDYFPSKAVKKISDIADIIMTNFTSMPEKQTDKLINEEKIKNDLISVVYDCFSQEDIIGQTVPQADDPRIFLAKSKKMARQYYRIVRDRVKGEVEKKPVILEVNEGEIDRGNLRVDIESMIHAYSDIMDLTKIHSEYIEEVDQKRKEIGISQSDRDEFETLRTSSLRHRGATAPVLDSDQIVKFLIDFAVYLVGNKSVKVHQISPPEIGIDPEKEKILAEKRRMEEEVLESIAAYERSKHKK